MTMRYPEGIPQRRPRGRPRVGEPLSSVTAWLPPGDYDRLVKMAERQTDGNVSALVRRIIIVTLPRD